MRAKTPPLLVAIVGGSGAGKSWLADHLQKSLGRKAARISLDDFYRDRSHLTPARRSRINFDHPRAIDWPCVEKSLRDCAAFRPTRLPRYDFKNHVRLPQSRHFSPRPIIIMDGLWLLRRPVLRRLFAFAIFIDYPTKIRLKRRLARDLLLRGRKRASVTKQFWDTVEPMNARYVAPQARWAHIVLKPPVNHSTAQRLAASLLARPERVSA